MDWVYITTLRRVQNRSSIIRVALAAAGAGTAVCLSPGSDGGALVVLRQVRHLARSQDVFEKGERMPMALDEIPVSGCTCFNKFYV